MLLCREQRIRLGSLGSPVTRFCFFWRLRNVSYQSKYSFRVSGPSPEMVEWPKLAESLDIHFTEKVLDLESWCRRALSLHFLVLEPAVCHNAPGVTAIIYSPAPNVKDVNGLEEGHRRRSCSNSPPFPECQGLSELFVNLPVDPFRPSLNPRRKECQYSSTPLSASSVIVPPSIYTSILLILKRNLLS